jgi:hypothetical protein
LEALNLLALPHQQRHRRIRGGVRCHHLAAKAATTVLLLLLLLLLLQLLLQQLLAMKLMILTLQVVRRLRTGRVKIVRPPHGLW